MIKRIESAGETDTQASTRKARESAVIRLPACEGILGGSGQQALSGAQRLPLSATDRLAASHHGSHSNG